MKKRENYFLPTPRFQFMRFTLIMTLKNFVNKVLTKHNKVACSNYPSWNMLKLFKKTSTKWTLLKSTLFNKVNKVQLCLLCYLEFKFFKVLSAFQVSRVHFNCFWENKVKQSETLLQSFVQSKTKTKWHPYWKQRKLAYIKIKATFFIENYFK